jgi:hypothetical protein
MIPKMLRASGIFILLTFFYSQNGFPVSIVRTVAGKSEIKSPDYLKASVFVNLTAKEFAIATGAKLNFLSRIYFKVIQHKLRKDLKNNPDLLIADYFDQKKAKFKFDALWFVIGAFIGPLGVLLSYFSHEQKKGPLKKDRIKSAWLGFAFFVIWFGLLFIF